MLNNSLKSNFTTKNLYALVGILLGVAISMFVVTSVYYSFIPSQDEIRRMQQQAAPVDDVLYRCLPGYPECNDTPNQNSAADSCLVGSLDCNDAPDAMIPSGGAPEIYVPLSSKDAKFISKWGYMVVVPAGLEAYGYDDSNVSIGNSRDSWHKWTFEVVAYNSPADATLEDSIQEVIAGIVQKHGEPETRTNFYKVEDVMLDNVAAKRIKLLNYQIGFDTIIIAKNIGNNYVIYGRSVESSNKDINAFAKTFEFTK